MKFVFLIFCAFAVVTAKAQISLPSQDSLFASVDRFYYQSLVAELTVFESNPKDYWMNFVPSVGVGYNLQGKPRPSVSFSLNSLFQVRQQKRQVAAMQESIILKNHLERQKTKAKVSKIYQQIELLQEELNFSLKVFEIEQQLFEFYEKQNENYDIKPSEFLIKKITHLKKEESIRLQKREIDMLILELLEVAHYDF